MATAVLFFLLLLLLSLSYIAFSKPPSSDADALLLLKESFTNTDDDPLKDWSSSSTKPPCSWTGIVCDNDIINGFRLANLNLSGNLNVDALFHFKALRSISLNDNNLTGPIPPISHLDGLKSVYLSNNKFSGPIPDDFFNEMDHLKKLWLDGNSLTGSVPSSLSKATSLMELHLDRNNFTGEIPDLDIKSLQKFNISNNAGLTGAIPAKLAKFGPDSFQGNSNLCGPPLSPCDVEVPEAVARNSAGTEEKGGSGNKTAVTIIIVLVLTVMIAFGLTTAKRHRDEMSPFDGMGDEAMEAAADTVSVAGSSHKSRGSVHKRNGSNRASGTTTTKGTGGGAAELVMVNEEKGVFGLSDLMKASAEVLGNGGMGSVYKATMTNRVGVAVKRMREMNRVGKDVFDSEMRNFGRLRHKNVLCPLAYHYRKEEKLVVSEFVTRGSLLYLLHGDRGQDHAALDWPIRLKIIRGVVGGLAYLHKELTSIDVPHGNLKSGNILLDHDFEPLLVDYGFISLINPTQAPTILFAYKSPEAILHHTVCPKSDIYCLGIIILEIITGKFPSQYLNNSNGGTDVLQWASSAMAEGREAELVDPDIAGPARDSVEDMVKLLKIGVACADADPEKRPHVKEVAAMVDEIASGEGAEEGEPPKLGSFKEAYNGESSERSSMSQMESMGQGS